MPIIRHYYEALMTTSKGKSIIGTIVTELPLGLWCQEHGLTLVQTHRERVARSYEQTEFRIAPKYYDVLVHTAQGLPLIGHIVSESTPEEWCKEKGLTLLVTTRERAAKPGELTELS